MVYLTFGNQSDGVFSSYVTDVCSYMSSEFDEQIKIISFISLRGFFKVRKSRKKLYPNTLVLPLFPKMKFWKINIVLLTILWPFFGKRKIIALSPIAANLALRIKKLKLADTVIYDGEGATYAEWNEYDVVDDDHMIQTIHGIESKAVNDSDYRRTVSTKMIDYWRKEFNYSKSEHTVIPCTLNSVFFEPLKNEQEIAELRKEWGFDEGDVIFVYAGSTAQWQSFDLVDEMFSNLLALNKNYKVLFLSQVTLDELVSYQKFPNRVKKGWLDFKDVPQVLSMCDYGILVRRNSVTNQVAAPTKFAEYLSRGLKVLISSEIGDYSEFTIQNNTGFIVGDELHSELKNLERVDYPSKMNLSNIAQERFTNSYYREEFKKIIDK